MDFNSTTNLHVLDVFYWERLFVCVFIGLSAIVGMIGNSMIILAVSFSRTLQTPTNAFVTNLSVADLLTSFFVVWSLVSLLNVDGWPFPQSYWLCQATGFMIIACVGASTYNLGLIALNRLILIVRPNLYKKIFSSWKLVFLVAIPWIVPGGSEIVVLATGNGAVGFDTDGTCSDIESHERSEVFINGQIAIGFPLPLAAILFSYVWIYIYLKRHFHTQKQLIRNDPEPCKTSTLSTQTSSSEILNDEDINRSSTSDVQLHACHQKVIPNTRRRERISHQQIQITKNLFVIVCAFIACYTPYCIVSPFAEESDLAFHIKFYFQIPIYLNSAINVFIYARKHPDFKIVIGHMLRLSFADITKPLKFLKLLLSINI